MAYANLQVFHKKTYVPRLEKIVDTDSVAVVVFSSWGGRLGGGYCFFLYDKNMPKRPLS